MRKILQLKINTRSVYVKMLTSFFAIILLFVSFNVVSLTFFRQNIHDEIIKYNDNNLTNTTYKFEQYFQLLNSVILGLYLNNNYINNSNRSYIDYVGANHFMNDLQSIVANPQLYLDNLFVYDVKLSLVLEKSRGSSLDVMFSEHYYNPNYTSEFWKREFSGHYGFKLYPVAVFSEGSKIPPFSQTGKTLPFMVTSSMYPDFTMLAFIDANKLYHALHQSINNNFYILDPQGNPLFSSDSTGQQELPDLVSGKNWVKQNHFYYFYKKESVTGFTYVNIVPDVQISSQIRWNITLIVLLVISVFISIAASLFFSMRFNNPVKRIVESIQHLNEKKTLGGSFSEFDLIGENIGRMLRLNKDTLSDLEEKRSLLRYYSFINRLKKIRSGDNEAHQLGHEHQSEYEHQSFRFALFQLTFKMQFLEDMRGEEERATYFIREYVNQAMSKEFKGAQTFQIEANQILSIVYSDEHDEQWNEVLGKIRNVLAADSKYCFFTIAVSSLYHDSSQMTAAYEEVLDLIKHRPFDDETRILETKEIKAEPFVLQGALEQEIHVNLQEGNDELVLQLLGRVLGQMKKKEIAASRFHRFAEEITDKVMRMLHTLQLDTRCVSGLSGLISSIHTVEELERYFETLISEAGRLIRVKKEERDPVISFVGSYLKEHYAEDITLDLVAGKMNITGGYLSTYFKEKTGINFVDYVNEFRIRQAMDLLLQTDLKIQDIAVQTGYQTMSSFNRTFKKFAGITPSEYRRYNASM